MCEFNNCVCCKKVHGQTFIGGGEGLILLTKHHLNIILSGFKVGYYQVGYFKSDQLGRCFPLKSWLQFYGANHLRKLQSSKISKSCTMDECVISFFMFSSLVSKFSFIVQLQLFINTLIERLIQYSTL